MHALRAFYCYESKTPDWSDFSNSVRGFTVLYQNIKKGGKFFCCDTGQPITTVTS